MLMLTGCVPEEAPPAADPTAQQALNIANTNTGSIQALAARVGTVEGRTAGEVTQAELDALAGQVATLGSQVAELQEQIDELNSTGTGNPSDSTVVATETRWRPEVSYSIGLVTGSAGSADDIAVGINKIDPFPIREAEVYVIEIVVQNKSAADTVKFELANLALTLTPSEGVIVSKYVDVYQIGAPYGVWWYTTVSTNPTTGLCRRIRAEADLVELTLAKETSATFKLELELVYGK
jgi:outer membrane murein-binding lipoprotein Lpp